jgi:hypothetical protein
MVDFLDIRQGSLRIHPIYDLVTVQYLFMIVGFDNHTLICSIPMGTIHWNTKIACMVSSTLCYVSRESYFSTAQKYQSAAFVHSVYGMGDSEKISVACNVHMNFVITDHEHML